MHDDTFLAKCEGDISYMRDMRQRLIHDESRGMEQLIAHTYVSPCLIMPEALPSILVEKLVVV